MATEVLETQVAFKLTDNVSAGLARIGENTDRLAAKTAFLTTAYSKVASAGAQFARHLIHLGVEAEQTRESIAGIIFATGDWDKASTPAVRMAAAMEAGAERAERLEEITTRLAVPLPQVAAGFNTIATSVSNLGLSYDQIQDLTLGATAAQKVLGADMGAVGRVIQQGILPRFGQFGAYLRTQIADVKVFQKLAPEKRYEMIQKALKNLVPAADEMSKGFDDTLFRIRHTGERVFKDLTGPLFGAVSSKLEELSKKLSQAGASGKPLVQEIGEKLVDAFNKVSALAEKLLDNWKAIAAVVGGIKVGGMLSGAGSAGGMLSGLGSTGQALGGFAAKLGAATMATGLLVGGLEVLIGWLDKRQTEDIALKGQGEIVRSVLNAQRAGDTQLAFKLLKSSGLVDPQRGIDPSKAKAIFGSSVEAKAAATVRYGGGSAATVGSLSTDELSGFFTKTLNDSFRAAGLLSAPATTLDGLKAPKGTEKKPPVLDMRGSKIEVKMDFEQMEPDRVFVRFKNDLEKYAENRISSVLTIPSEA